MSADEIAGRPVRHHKRPKPSPVRTDGASKKEPKSGERAVSPLLFPRSSGKLKSRAGSSGPADSERMDAYMNRRTWAVLAAVILSVCLFAGCGGRGQDKPTMITKAPGTVRTTTTAGSGGSTEPNTPEAPETTAPTGTGSPADPTTPKTTAQTVAPDPGASAAGTAIASLANSLVGTTFKIGGVGPTEFDNPGFVYYCYKQNGITVPRKASAMAQDGTAVDRASLQAGDIVVFSNEIGGAADFVGIYVGSGKFVSCNNPNQPTGVQSLDTGYWAERFLSGRRYGG